RFIAARLDRLADRPPRSGEGSALSPAGAQRGSLSRVPRLWASGAAAVKQWVLVPHATWQRQDLEQDESESRGVDPDLDRRDPGAGADGRGPGVAAACAGDGDRRGGG